MKHLMSFSSTEVVLLFLHNWNSFGLSIVQILALRIYLFFSFFNHLQLIGFYRLYCPAGTASLIYVILFGLLGYCEIVYLC